MRFVLQSKGKIMVAQNLLDKRETKNWREASASGHRHGLQNVEYSRSQLHCRRDPACHCVYRVKIKWRRELVEASQVYQSFPHQFPILPLHFSLHAQRKTKQKERAPCCFDSI
jgi:hypothetical protein